MLSITLLHINSKTVLSLCPRGEKRAKRTESATDVTLAGRGRLGTGRRYEPQDTLGIGWHRRVPRQLHKA